MKKLIALVCLLPSILFSQQTITRSVEVYEEAKLTQKDLALGLLAGPTMYFGESKNQMSFHAGIGIEKYYNPKFSTFTKVFYANLGYVDTSDASQSTTLFGLDFLGNVNLATLFSGDIERPKFSPYLGFGFGIINSQASHYLSSNQVDISIPLALGFDFSVNDKLSLGLDVNARYLLTDNFDNNITSKSNDLFLMPAISIKYLIKNKTITRRVKVTKDITYTETEEKEEPKPIEKYTKPEEKEIKPYVETTVIETKPKEEVKEITKTVIKGDTKETTVITKKEEETKPKEEEKEVVKETTKKSSSSTNNDLFFTVQIGAYSKKGIDLEDKYGVACEIQIYDKDRNLYYYCTGKYATNEEAEAAQKKIKAKTNRGYVVAFNKGEKIDVSDAIKMQE